MMDKYKQGVNTMKINEILNEAPLTNYDLIGDFSDKTKVKGNFRGADRALVSHPVTMLKTAKFFKNTSVDFRLFFANVSGTNLHRETGKLINPEDRLPVLFGNDAAEKILDDYEDAITVVFLGNYGTEKVPMTPWTMAHRIGHAIQASFDRHYWKEAEKFFFKNINNILEEAYGIRNQEIGFNTMWRNQDSLYNTFFNTIGTQKSSRDGKINRPYEFFYECFAQFINTGTVTFNPAPNSIRYGRKNWGKSSQGAYLRIPQEEANQMLETLGSDMEYMFGDVLSTSVGNIYLM